MKYTLMAAAFLACLTTSHGQQVTLDGILTPGDGYTNSESVTWFNGHGKESVYGDFDNQSFQTTLRYGIAELAGGTPGEKFFFLFVEAPLYAKNMIWGNGLTEADWAPYGKELSFSGATGSEKLVFLNAKGDKVFEADLADKADNGFGLVGYKDSAHYLLDSGISTEDSSLARDTTMSFEFQFAVDPTNNAQIVAYARNGLEMHLSPERGLVPEPSSSVLIGLSSMLFLFRRKR